MGNYVVRWEVEAPDFDSPEQAALFAEERMQDPLGQRPPVFKVLDTDTGVTKVFDMRPGRRPIWPPK
jgi:hypothetical protein